MSKNIDSSQKESNTFVHKQPPFIWASKKITQPSRPIKPYHASPTPSTGAAKEDDLVLPLPDQLLHCFPVTFLFHPPHSISDSVSSNLASLRPLNC